MDEMMGKLEKQLMSYLIRAKDQVKLFIFRIILIFRGKNNPNFFFVQIGSCDGFTEDPIQKYVTKYHWSGVLVEPVKYLFEKLVKNYGNEKKLIFENSAISDENGLRDFYRLRQSNDLLPIWYDQLGSFLINNVLKHKGSIPDIETRIVEEKVPTMTLAQLIRKHSISRIDLLHIDAEGYDYEILKQIGLVNIKPRMILYENKHLTPGDCKLCEIFLRKNGYFLMRIQEDTFAVSPGIRFLSSREAF